MKIKINGTKYDITKRTTKDLDAYLKRGLFVDTVKYDKAYKYEANVDGMIIGVCKKSRYFIETISVIIFIMCCILLGLYLKDSKVDHSDESIDTGEEVVKHEKGMPILEDPVLLRYNKFCIYKNGEIDLRLVNGDFDAKIVISGENIECEPLEVSTKEEVLSVPIKIDTNNELLNAELVYTYSKGTERYPLIIENIMDVQEIEEDITLENEEVIYE